MINSRDMRLMIIFDLPSIESYEKKEYRNFRKALIKNGFMMLQFSVYVREYNRQINIRDEVRKIEKWLPSSGSIRAIGITECQWQNMEIVLGNKTFDQVINEPKRFIKI